MRRFFALLTLSWLAAGGVLAQNEPRVNSPAAEKPAFGQKLRLPGIPNAGKISDVLYRGAQPHARGFPELQKLGVTTIVDLREENAERIQWERKEAESLGIRFVHIPVNAWRPPADEQVAQFLALFRNEPRQRIFVHCRLGDDRTGVFVATYRMALQKWTSERSVEEMVYFGFHDVWHPSMQAYARDFPAHLNSAPALAAFRPGSAAP